MEELGNVEKGKPPRERERESRDCRGGVDRDGLFSFWILLLLSAS